MTTEEAIQIICKAIEPTRPEGDDGLPSMEQGIVEMYLKSYTDNSWVPQMPPVSRTAGYSEEAYQFSQAIRHLLHAVREAQQ